MATLRRVVFDSTGHTVVAQATLTITAPPAPGKKLIGMSAPAGEWNARVAEVGTVGLKARRIFADLAKGAQSQANLIQDAVDAGMLPVVSYKVGGNFTGAATGAFDAVATQAAAFLASFDVPMAVVVWHEPTGNMTGTQFVAMQRRLMPKFKGVGKLKVGPILNGFLLTQPAQPAGVNEFTGYTAPDLMNLWDWFGIDTYQPGTVTNPNTSVLPADRLEVLADWLQAQAKPDMPVGVGEFNGFSAAAIAGMGEALLSIPNVWFGCVWNVDEARAGILTGTRLAAFKTTKSDTRAQQ